MTGSTFADPAERYGFAVSQARAAPIVATAVIESTAAPFAWKRSRTSTASRPTIGIAKRVAQKVKRSKVKISKARPEATGEGEWYRQGQRSASPKSQSTRVAVCGPRRHGK